MSPSPWAAAGLGDFALLLCLAAAAKLASPSGFAAVVTRVLPRSWWGRHPRLVAQSARIAALTEAAAAPIVVFGGTAGAGLAAALAAVFVAVVWRVSKRGVSCGCWGAWSPGRAGGPDLARATLLAVICAGVFAAMVGGVRPRFGAPALGAAGLILAALVAAGHLGARLQRPKPTGETPTPVPVPARGAAQTAAWLLLAATPPPPPSPPAPAHARDRLPERPLWPWQNRRTLRRWQAAAPVADKLARIEATVADLAWDRAVVRQTGTERTAWIIGSGVQLVVSETKGTTGPIVQCWAIATRTTAPSGTR